MTKSSITVHIGEVKIASGDQELHTILGSCIGIGLLCPKRGVYGLAHCLLPVSPALTKEIGARYVDQAVNSLIELLEITNTKDVRAVVAGGANMTKPDAEHPEKLVGALNAKNAIAQLSARNINIVYEDIGGEIARKMIIHCATRTFEVKHIPRLAA